MELHNIGIVLSGGGIRATIFHLGVLKWVAEKGVLEQVKRVSATSPEPLRFKIDMTGICEDIKSSLTIINSPAPRAVSNRQRERARHMIIVNNKAKGD